MQASSQLTTLLILLINRINNGRFIVSVDDDNARIFSELQMKISRVCFTEVNASSNVQKLREDAYHRDPVLIDLTTDPYSISEPLWTLAQASQPFLPVFKVQHQYCFGLNRTILAAKRAINGQDSRIVIDLCQKEPHKNIFNFTYKQSAYDIRICDDLKMGRCNNTIGFGIQPDKNLNKTLEFLERMTASTDCPIDCRGRQVLAASDAQKSKWGCDKCLLCPQKKKRKKPFSKCWPTSATTNNNTLPVAPLRINGFEKRKWRYGTALSHIHIHLIIFLMLSACILILYLELFKWLRATTYSSIVILATMLYFDINQIICGHEKAERHPRHSTIQRTLTIVLVAAMGPNKRVYLAVGTDSSSSRWLWINRALICSHYAVAILILCSPRLDAVWVANNDLSRGQNCYVQKYVAVRAWVPFAVQIGFSMLVNFITSHHHHKAAPAPHLVLTHILGATIRSVAPQVAIALALWLCNGRPDRYYRTLARTIIILATLLWPLLKLPECCRKIVARLAPEQITIINRVLKLRSAHQIAPVVVNHHQSDQQTIRYKVVPVVQHSVAEVT